MSSPRAKIKARKRKAKISKEAARKRAIKGWETRRRNNPDLANIKATGRKTYEWNRPSGEKVPLKNFTPEEVELMAPALRATDKHLKKKQNVNTEIHGNKLLFHNYVTASLTGGRVGGWVAPTRSVDPDRVSRLEKTVYKRQLKVDPDAWGNYNQMVINKFALKRPNPGFHPTGILAHEIGHLVGPATDMQFSPTYSNEKGHTVPEVKRFEKDFQWEAPKLKEGSRIRLDRNGDYDVESGFIDRARWMIKGNHPGATSEYKKGTWAEGLASSVTRTYQNYDHREDFAESYRSYVGVPIDMNSEKPSEWWDWKDTKNRSRKSYMESKHLSKAAKPGQYRDEVTKATQAHKTKMQEMRSSRKAERKAKIQQSVGRRKR